MKYIFFITLLLQLNLSRAQNDNAEKPSWTEDLPEMIDTPDINIEPTVDTKIEFEMDELRMDRADIFGDSEEEADVRPNFDSEEENTNTQEDQEKLLAEQAALEQAAQEKLLAEQAAAEQAAIEQAAIEQAAREKELAEQAAAEQAALEQELAEQAAIDKATEEKAEQELAEAEQSSKEISQDLISQDATQESENSISETNQNSEYGWDIVVNVLPKYPLRAARTSEEGWVDVRLEINSNGDVVSTEVIRSYRNSQTFHRAALDAVKEWKFDPPSKYGIYENLFKSYKIMFKL